MRRTLATMLTVGVVLGAGYRADAQNGAEAPASAQAAAPVDLTGTYVSVITEDWRWRMVTPARGDYASIPLTPEGVRVADTWDPARDTATGEACRSYAAPALLRVPGRVRISWQDANTLRLEADAGTQTRLFHFGPGAAAMDPGAPSFQGFSVAEWERGDGDDLTGSLKVVTTNLRPGYLRKNGVPYSANAVLTEYYDLERGPDGTPWLVVTSVVEDPQYLQKRWVTSPNFKKEADDAGWNPSACSATW